jgi:hypothetical protein
VDKTLAARRLSAAIGLKVEPESIDVIYGGRVVKLKNGNAFLLVGGNAAYLGDGVWLKNGRVWNIAPDEDVRPLPVSAQHAG